MYGKLRLSGVEKVALRDDVEEDVTSVVMHSTLTLLLRYQRLLVSRFIAADKSQNIVDVLSLSGFTCSRPFLLCLLLHHVFVVKFSHTCMVISVGADFAGCMSFMVSNEQCRCADVKPVKLYFPLLCCSRWQWAVSWWDIAFVRLCFCWQWSPFALISLRQDIVISRTQNSYSDTSFAVGGPRVWNGLPSYLHWGSTSVERFAIIPAIECQLQRIRWLLRTFLLGVSHGALLLSAFLCL